MQVPLSGRGDERHVYDFHYNYWKTFPCFEASAMPGRISQSLVLNCSTRARENEKSRIRPNQSLVLQAKRRKT